MRLELANLRAHAIHRCFFTPTTLRRAIEKMGFVQADPIRSPARAQDLILRHRVKQYCAGDLERSYPKLDIEEDFFYAYGFLPRAHWHLLHPRDIAEPTALEKRVLDLVQRRGYVHPRELAAELGRARQVNPWGGFSEATTRTLQLLHYRGHLRIARRDAGIRIYAAAPPLAEPLSWAERSRRLVLLVCRILAPISQRSLVETLRLLQYGVQGFKVDSSLAANLLKSGELESAAVDGIIYLWPAGKLLRRSPPQVVRILTPFDPLVWDRRRFEHFWGWAYRFEAYTPERLRVRGYYAMPLLWGDQVVGWANARIVAGKLTVRVGFAEKKISEPAFRDALAEEIARFRLFLKAG